MAADVTTAGYSDSLYTVAASVSADAVNVTSTVTVDHSFPITGDSRQSEAAMFWVNGVYAGILDDGRVTRVASGDRWTYTAVLPRGDGPNGGSVAPGPAQFELVVSLFTQAGATITYLPPMTKTPPSAFSAPDLTTVPALEARNALSPGRIVRTLFHCSASEINSTSGLKAALAAAGVNTITGGLFMNPADNGSWTTFEIWEAAVFNPNNLATPNGQMKWARDNGFKYLATGDDFYRNGDEANFILTSPWAEDAVRRTGQLLEEYSDIVLGVEMGDEFGTGPGTQVHRNVVDWLRLETDTPLAWPDKYPFGWEVPEWSDYASRYWTDIEFRNGRSDGLTLWQNASGIGGRPWHTGAASQLPAEWPWICLISVAGPYYTKLVAGGDYVPGSDLLQKGGNRAIDIVAQCWLALAHGASGLRLYGYDFTEWQVERATAVVGRTDLQTGARPGDARWPGVVAGLTSIASRESALLDGYRPGRTAGPWVLGYRDDLRWYVNTSEIAEALDGGGTAYTLVTPDGEEQWDGGTVPPGGVVIWELSGGVVVTAAGADSSRVTAAGADSSRAAAAGTDRSRVTVAGSLGG